MKKLTALGLVVGLLGSPVLAQNKIEFKEFTLDGKEGN